MFELVIWSQVVTLIRWTQPSGPLCLWQCFKYLCYILNTKEKRFHLGSERTDPKGQGKTPTTVIPSLQRLVGCLAPERRCICCQRWRRGDLWSAETSRSHVSGSTRPATNDCDDYVDGDDDTMGMVMITDQGDDDRLCRQSRASSAKRREKGARLNILWHKNTTIGLIVVLQNILRDSIVCKQTNGQRTFFCIFFD